MSFKIETFLFDTPLYTKIAFKDDKFGHISFDRLLRGNNNELINGYNPFNHLETSFEVIKRMENIDGQLLAHGGLGVISLRCVRTDSMLNFYFNWSATEGTLKKVGQHPSVADFHIAKIKNYSKVLEKSKLREFTKAIGLAANGVGIGSFVYLRRVYEHLINEAFKLALDSGNVDKEEFGKAKMAKKILMLEGYLPKFLVEHKEMYSILSLGVHSLDEQDCLLHFDVLKTGIEIILDEKIKEKEAKEKELLAAATIKKLNSSLKKDLKQKKP